MSAVTPNQSLSLENIGDEGFLSILTRLGEKPKTTIRLFDRGDFYTVHNEDALFTAKEFFKTTTIIKELGRDTKKTPSVALSKLNFENFVRELLLIRHYRVELYRSKGGRSSQWELVGKASPGNLQQFEDILFGNIEMSSSAIVLSVKLGRDSNGGQVVGVSFVDSSERKIFVCEFADNDQYSNFESLVIQVGPKECVMRPQDVSANGGNLKAVLERSNILITEMKSAEYSSKDIVQDLSRLLKNGGDNVASLNEVGLKEAMCCLSSIIKYLELLSDESMFNQMVMKLFDLNQYMLLDSAAVRALNILPSPQDGGNRSMCLFGLLNTCKTSQGQRLLSQWVKQPLLDKEKIEERLNIVEAIYDNADLLQQLKVKKQYDGYAQYWSKRYSCMKISYCTIMVDHCPADKLLEHFLGFVEKDKALKRIPDLSRLSKKFQTKKATLQDCVRVYQSLKQLPTLLNILKQYDGEHKVTIDDVFSKTIQDMIGDFLKYLEMIETTVDLEEVEQNHDYLIRAEFDEALQECKCNMDDVTSQFPSVLNKAARELGLEAGKTIKLESNSQLGHYMRVTLKEEKVLRNNKKFTTLETRKDGVRFTNSSLSRMSEDYKSHKTLYNELQSNLAKEVVNIAAGYAEPLQCLSDLIAYLDVLLSFATVASQAPIPYVRPVIREKGAGKIILKGSRHPCLEVQDDVAFIANDVNLNKDEQELLIITGPNMGGKSTYIRQVGLITLMAQIGSFVPCTSAEISIMESILARVGAGDSQLKGVSTFMSEMLETSAILRAATKDSLVIIDELGRGTSTYDGFGLAWAISEHIATKVHSFCLFATHFHELTSLADEVPVVSNYHVSALTSAEQLTLLYKVKPGVCDQSFGIHVAQIVKFPDHVITFAKEKAKELEDFRMTSSAENLDETQNNIENARKRRLEKKEGEQLVKKFLMDLRNIPTSGRSNDEILADVTSVKNNVLTCGNKYLLDFVSK